VRAPGRSTIRSTTNAASKLRQKISEWIGITNGPSFIV